MFKSDMTLLVRRLHPDVSSSSEIGQSGTRSCWMCVIYVSLTSPEKEKQEVVRSAPTILQAGSINLHGRPRNPPPFSVASTFKSQVITITSPLKQKSCAKMLTISSHSDSLGLLTLDLLHKSRSCTNAGLADAYPMAKMKKSIFASLFKCFL